MAGEYDNDRVVLDVLEELRALQGGGRPMAGGVASPGRAPRNPNLSYQEGVRNRLTDIGAGVEAGVQKVFPAPSPEQTRQSNIIGERMNVQRLAEREMATNRLAGIFRRKPTEAAAPTAVPTPTKAPVAAAPASTTAVSVAKPAGLVKPKDIYGAMPSKKTTARPVVPSIEDIPGTIEPGVTSFGVTPPVSRPAPVRKDVAEGAAINEATRAKTMKENEAKRLDITARLGEAVKQSEFVRSPEVAMRNRGTVEGLQRELFLLENQKRDLESPSVAPTMEAPIDTGRRLMGPELVIDKGGVLREGRVSGVDEGDASEVEQIRGGIVSGGKTARGSEAGVLRQGLTQAIERGDMAGVEKLAKATQELETAALTRGKIPHVKELTEAGLGLTKAQTGKQKAETKELLQKIDNYDPKSSDAKQNYDKMLTDFTNKQEGKKVGEEWVEPSLLNSQQELAKAGILPPDAKLKSGTWVTFRYNPKTDKHEWQKR